MSQLTSTLNINEIHKGLNLLGLNLSDPELNSLTIGQTISLESRSLGELGSVFILAAALSSVNLGKIKKTVTFQDLPAAFTDSSCCTGIPIYCWVCESRNKSCIYLTLIDGKPAVRISNYSQ